MCLRSANPLSSQPEEDHDGAARFNASSSRLENAASRCRASTVRRMVRWRWGRGRRTARASGRARDIRQRNWPLSVMLPALRENLAKARPGDPRGSTADMSELMALLDEQDPATDIRNALRTVIDSGNRANAAQAAIVLGIVLSDFHDDAQGAASAFQAAIDTGHRRLGPEAALRLSHLRLRLGDRDAAEAAVRAGQRLLTSVLEQADRDQARGRVAAARARYEEVAECGYPHLASIASLSLGLLLERQGEPDAARSAYRRAYDSGDPDIAPMAAERLGWLLSVDDPHGARSMWRYAKKHGSDEVAEAAQFSLDAQKLGPDVMRLQQRISGILDDRDRGRDR